MIVVDANLLVYWTTDAPQADQIELLQRFDSDWRTVPLWRYEFANAMVQMVRNKKLSESRAVEAMTEADNLMTPREHDVSQAEVLRTAIRYDISAYDAQYIALAEELRVKCVTADVKLTRKTPRISVLLSEIDRLVP